MPEHGYYKLVEEGEEPGNASRLIPDRRTGYDIGSFVPLPERTTDGGVEFHVGEILAVVDDPEPGCMGRLVIRRTDRPSIRVEAPSA